MGFTLYRTSRKDRQSTLWHSSQLYTRTSKSRWLRNLADLHIESQHSIHTVQDVQEKQAPGTSILNTMLIPCNPEKRTLKFNTRAETVSNVVGRSHEVQAAERAPEGRLPRWAHVPPLARVSGVAGCSGALSAIAPSAVARWRTARPWPLH